MALLIATAIIAAATKKDRIIEAFSTAKFAHAARLSSPPSFAVFALHAQCRPAQKAKGRAGGMPKRPSFIPQDPQAGSISTL
jgi:hypothetical protein